MPGLFRVVLSGSTPAVGEIWSCGWHYVGPTNVREFAELQEWAQGIADALEVLTGNTLINFLSSAGSIHTVRVEQRSEVDESLMQAAEASLVPPKLGAGTPSKVQQACIVLSLLSGQPGRSFRGRVYWPAWSYTPTVGMRFTAGDTAAAVASFNNLVDLVASEAIQVDPGWTLQLIVRSRLLHLSTQIATVAAGDVPDVQRRRRDALLEVYSSAPVNP